MEKVGRGPRQRLFPHQIGGSPKGLKKVLENLSSEDYEKAYSHIYTIKGEANQVMRENTSRSPPATEI